MAENQFVLSEEWALADREARQLEAGVFADARCEAGNAVLGGKRASSDGFGYRIGIDPGCSGAIVVMDRRWNLIEWDQMPVIKVGKALRVHLFPRSSAPRGDTRTRDLFEGAEQ